MKYSPRQLSGNVNVSRTHPLVELAWLAGGLALLCLTALLLLGWGSDFAVDHLPPRYERWLGEHLQSPFPGEFSPPLQRRLEGLLQCLPTESPLRGHRFTIQVADSPEVNAVALPGWRIVVFRGLLEKVGSENELTMVLAHELGHFAHRDHLRSLGRGLGVTALSLLVFGRDSGISDAAGKLFLDVESHYSRRQEAAADSFALTLLVARYGHAGGATDFFRRFDGQAGSRIPYLLASHPHPADRIRDLDRAIAKNNYPLDPVVPLGDDLLPQLAARP
jgi:predicted Zn-dependent protease